MITSREKRTVNVLKKITGKQWVVLNNTTGIIERMNYFNPLPGCALSLNMSDKALDVLEKHSADNSKTPKVDFSSDLKKGHSFDEVKSMNNIKGSSIFNINHTDQKSGSKPTSAANGSDSKYNASYYMPIDTDPQKGYKNFVDETCFPIIKQIQEIQDNNIAELKDLFKMYTGFFFNQEGNYVIYNDGRLKIGLKATGNLAITAETRPVIMAGPGMQAVVESEPLKVGTSGLKDIFEGFYFTNASYTKTDERHINIYNSALKRNDIDASFTLNLTGEAQVAPGVVTLKFTEKIDEKFELLTQTTDSKVDWNGSLELYVTYHKNRNDDDDGDEWDFHGPYGNIVTYWENIVALMPGHQKRFNLKPGTGLITTNGNAVQTNLSDNTAPRFLNRENLNNSYKIMIHTENKFLPAAGIGIAALAIFSAGYGAFYIGTAFSSAEAVAVTGTSLSNLKTAATAAKALVSA